MTGYVLVYLKETDGDPYLEQLGGKDSVIRRIKELRLTHNDYAIVEGVIEKSFNSRIDLTKLC